MTLKINRDQIESDATYLADWAYENTHVGTWIDIYNKNYDSVKGHYKDRVIGTTAAGIVAGVIYISATPVMLGRAIMVERRTRSPRKLLKVPQSIDDLYNEYKNGNLEPSDFFYYTGGRIVRRYITDVQPNKGGGKKSVDTSSSGAESRRSSSSSSQQNGGRRGTSKSNRKGNVPYCRVHKTKHWCHFTRNKN